MILERPWLKHVVEENPREIDIPEISLVDLFKHSVEKYDNKTAITFYNQTYTYGKLHILILKMASALHKMGIRKGIVLL